MKQLNIYALILFSLLAFSQTSYGDLDKDSQKALDQTQELLKSQTQRDQYIKNNPQAVEADQKVKDISSSPQDQQAIYDISAQVFSTTTHSTNGDAEKQKEMMLKAAANPEEFLKSLPADQRAQIHNLAVQIEKNNQAVSPQH
jgi:hypothetical protein